MEKWQRWTRGQIYPWGPVWTFEAMLWSCSSGRQTQAASDLLSVWPALPESRLASFNPKNFGEIKLSSDDEGADKKATLASELFSSWDTAAGHQLQFTLWDFGLSCTSLSVCRIWTPPGSAGSRCDVDASYFCDREFCLWRKCGWVQFHKAHHRIVRIHLRRMKYDVHSLSPGHLASLGWVCETRLNGVEVHFSGGCRD